MVTWAKNLIAERRERKQRREREWIVDVAGASNCSELWLHCPRRYSSAKEWANWSKVHVTILSLLQRHWPDPHTYIRLDTYYHPENLIAVATPEQLKKIAKESKGEAIFFVEDCQDARVWEAVFNTGTNEDCGRFFVMLDHKPPNWLTVAAGLFEITRAIFLRRAAVADFETELSICRCLCFTADDDLVIAKADLPESALMHIIEDVARERDLELVLHRSGGQPRREDHGP